MTSGVEDYLLWHWFGNVCTTCCYCLLYYLHIAFIFMLLTSDTISEDIMFLGCPVVPFVCPFIRSSGQILLPRYLMNGVKNVDKTDKECSIVLTDDLVRLT